MTNAQASMAEEPAPLNQNRKPVQSRFGLATLNVLGLLLGFFILRLVLFFHFRPESPLPALDPLKAFLAGFHLDLLVALTLTAPLVMWLAIVPNSWFAGGWHRFLLRAALGLFWAIQVFLLCAEFFFFDEFKSRFNTVAVDYLHDPHEVFVNIWDTYPVAWVVAGCAIVAGIILLSTQKALRHIWDSPASGK